MGRQLASGLLLSLAKQKALLDLGQVFSAVGVSQAESVILLPGVTQAPTTNVCSLKSMVLQSVYEKWRVRLKTSLIGR